MMKVCGGWLMIIKDKMRLSNSYPNCAESIFSGCLKGGGYESV